MKTLFLALLLCGCAGSQVDRDFRSKVKSDTMSASGEYDPMTHGTRGTFTNTVEFRDPSK